MRCVLCESSTRSPGKANAMGGWQNFLNASNCQRPSSAIHCIIRHLHVRMRLRAGPQACFSKSSSLLPPPTSPILMRRPQAQRAAAVRAAAGSGRHAQSAVGTGASQDAAAAAGGGSAAMERNSGSFRFWIDERRFKGSADKCLVQEALFAAGGVRTGGYPKAAPIAGPLGWQRSGDWDLLWSPARSALRAAPALRAGQLASAVPGLYSLTKKRRLAATLASAYGDDAWRLVPHSFSLPAELPAWRAWLDAQAAAGLDPGPWMLKTAQHLGKGLVLLPGEEAYAAAQQLRAPSGKPYVLAQRYVSDPMLIAGRKFGIRLWLLVTGADPFTAYVHNQGLVLFSTESYDVDSLSDDEGAAGRGHITNYAQNVDGTVWSLAMLKQHLGAAAHRALWASLVSSAAHVACAAMPEVRAERSKLGLPANTTFELLGLDYLVDSSGHPWLLEVNGTPSLAVKHGSGDVEQLIRSTKGAMVSDMMSLLGVKQRFLPRYGLAAPGVRLRADAAACAQAALARDDDASAKARVDRELRHRGGFLPLMGHYPVLQRQHGASSSDGAPAGSSSGASSSGTAVHGDGGGSAPASAAAAAAAAAAPEVLSHSDDDTSDDEQDGSGGASSSSSGCGGLSWSERDKQLFGFMAAWWRKQRKLVAARKKLQEAAISQRQRQQQQQQQGAPPDEQPAPA